MTEPKPISDGHLPQSTHQGVMDILGLKVNVYRLDDGRTVIEADDMQRLLEKLFGETDS